MRHIKSDNRGMILVFTLLLLGVFLSTALSFSYFVIGDINKARAIDDSVIAYYSADAGMEESLYLLKNQSATDKLAAIMLSRPGDNSLDQSKGKWNIGESTNYEQAVLRQRLYNGQSVKFFILNRPSNKTESITLEWQKGLDNAGEKTPANLQVNMTQLIPQVQSSTLVYYQDTSQLEVADSETGIKCYDLKDLDFNKQPITTPPDYLLEFKVFGGSDTDYVERLSVKAYNGVCTMAEPQRDFNPQGITNLTLKSKGTYGRATQNIIAQILPRDPVSGILSFVLFSESDVIKE